MKTILFILLAAAAFVITSGFAGLIANFIPSPSEFIATLVAAVATIYLTYRLSRYKQWPVAVFALLLILIGLSSSLVVKKMIFARSASTALNITVEEAGDNVRKDFLSFSDSRIEYDKSGYYLLQHYGDHHYYAFPILGEDWKDGDPVVAWTWARTRKAKDEAQQQRLVPNSANYGLRTREHAVKTNVAKSIEDAATTHNLNVPERIILLNWGELNSAKPFWSNWLNQFLIYISILVVSVLLQLLIRRKKADH